MCCGVVAPHSQEERPGEASRGYFTGQAVYSPKVFFWIIVISGLQTWHGRSSVRSTLNLSRCEFLIYFSMLLLSGAY